MRATAVIVAGIVLAPVAKASDGAMVMDEVKLCYLEYAQHYGANTCWAPTELSGAVMASCASKEDEMLTAMAEDPRFSAMRYEQRMSLRHKLRREWQPRIEKAVIDYRIANSLCR